MVSSKILDRFSWAGYPQLQWLRQIGETVLPSWILTPAPKAREVEVAEKDKTAEGNTAWEERREAEKTAEGWLREYPCASPSLLARVCLPQLTTPRPTSAGFIVVAGPHGSGKGALVEKIIDEEHKSVGSCCRPVPHRSARADALLLCAHSLGEPS